mmetsp:Transcript_31965/g.102264  ORF Transcript_31965/g.102264 Transcript_31965/m.102264 type:complete len:130 (-) Transcript_31965:62-451(-)
MQPRLQAEIQPRYSSWVRLGRDAPEMLPRLPLCLSRLPPPSTRLSTPPSPLGGPSPGPPMLKLALHRSGETDALAERGEPLLGQRLADTATPEVAMAVMASAAAAASEIGSSVAEAYGAALDSYAPRRD